MPKRAFYVVELGILIILLTTTEGVVRVKQTVLVGIVGVVGAFLVLIGIRSKEIVLSGGSRPADCGRVKGFRIDGSKIGSGIRLFTIIVHGSANGAAKVRIVGHDLFGLVDRVGPFRVGVTEAITGRF